LTDYPAIQGLKDLPETLAHESLGVVLSDGRTVVTATRRLARRLRAEFAPAARTGSWATPAALPWSAWLTERYRALRDLDLACQPRPLLDDFQSHALWTRALADDPAAGGLLMPGGAVEGFREAWQLLHDWSLSPAELAARGTEDGRVFLRVAAAYRRRLEELGCIDGAQLPAFLAGGMRAPQTSEWVLAGFDRLDPAQLALCRAPGIRASRASPPRRGGTVTLAAFPDLRQELEAAVAWARARLEADPGARLGIVVPDLEAHGTLVEELLDEALSPSRLLPGQAGAPRPWNVSLARPLADYPAVAVALLACRLPREHLQLAEVGRLLRTPFLAGASKEGGDRARLDAWARERAATGVSIHQLIVWLDGRSGAPPCPRLAEGLRGLLGELGAGPRRRGPSEWAAAITRGLRGLGWPGDEPMDSDTWQTVQAWAELLESLARLDVLGGPMSLGHCMAQLERMATMRRFQPETPEVPVQVLGLLETPGLAFDGLWVSGMHDGTLPASLRPCPLLPASLQRERGMPRACPDTELALARRIVERLATAAPEVRFSYPERREDEPLRPSPLLRRLPAPAGAAVSFLDLARRGFDSRHTERIEDRRGPPVEGEVRGGSGLLAAQSACPFQAFAVHRLAARPMESASPGVDALTRGHFVHLALRRLWESLQDRDGLVALDTSARQARVRAALESAATEALAGLPGGLVRIELEEAALRIAELLEIEMLRPPFRVRALESAVALALGPLRLRGRIDRLDEVPGGLAVIDYKSGQAAAGDWDGDRPREPQMPLYALACGNQVAALAYASLKPGAVGFEGRASTQEVLGAALRMRGEPSAEDWQAQFEGWRITLERLATAFAAGDARVDPLRVSGARSPCGYCHLQVLCRRDELVRAGALADD
jgi:ATP-dependent helicase/nuclease subunit B